MDTVFEGSMGPQAMRRAGSQIEALKERLGRTPTACVITFGCQMNARDSEKLEGVLAEAGFAITDSEDADFLLYNTCTVRENADNRLFGRLGARGSELKHSPWKKLAVCGCMMQEQINVEKIKKSYPYVDLIFGTHNLYTFPALLDAVYAPENEGEMIISILPEADRIMEELPARRKYPFKSGVNIMFGCDNYCTYCIVPYVRGRERSRKKADILAEVRTLAADGVREVMLLGQNVNSYGIKVPAGEEADYGTFPELLAAVAETPGIGRVRFMTSHPKDLSDELIEVIRTHDNISRHLHLPLQSGSDEILRRMNRRYTKEQYLSLCDRIRSSVPDIALTTDIIVGFPGETSADVDETIDVVRRVRFQNAFTFIYSRRNGTPAASYPDQPEPERVKRDFDRLLAVVQQTAREECGKSRGLTGTVMVEGVNENDPSLLTGRLSDNLLVHFPGTPDLIGKFTDVELTEAKGFYFLGKQIGTPW